MVLQHPKAICEIPNSGCVSGHGQWPIWTIYHLRTILASDTMLPKKNCIGIKKADTTCLNDGTKWPIIFKSPHDRMEILNMEWELYCLETPDPQATNASAYFTLACNLFKSTQVVTRLEKIIKEKTTVTIPVQTIKGAFKYNVLLGCQVYIDDCYLTRIGFCYSCDQPGKACNCSNDQMLPWSQTDMPLQNQDIPCVSNHVCGSKGVIYSP